ncbi:hypothetical protein, partial [Mycobacterium tuberculosis]|uniref:hypothetical protein n=1 Tax=Mycobacterium tuberculosis TaxID=1773 RepID=UPI001AE17505|nr:hypothetical protein [Mycobacterium tuberculosis]
SNLSSRNIHLSLALTSSRNRIETEVAELASRALHYAYQCADIKEIVPRKSEVVERLSVSDGNLSRKLGNFTAPLVNSD